MRFHTQTAGVSLTAQQPLNNLTRVAIQALAGVLGGTQSLHTDAYDEAWAVPSEDAAMLALRQQQILAEESGVANTVDPLGGSYFVETLTNQTEQRAWAYIRQIDEMGGMVRALEAGFPQAEIADAAYEQQRELEAKEREIVGVTKYADPDEELKIPLLEISKVQEQRHLDRLARVRAERDAVTHAAALRRLEDEARAGDVNLMPAIVAAVEAYATIGEMCGVLRGVYGEYREPLLGLIGAAWAAGPGRKPRAGGAGHASHTAACMIAMAAYQPLTEVLSGRAADLGHARGHDGSHHPRRDRRIRGEQDRPLGEAEPGELTRMRGQHLRALDVEGAVPLRCAVAHERAPVELECGNAVGDRLDSVRGRAPDLGTQPLERSTLIVGQRRKHRVVWTSHVLVSLPWPAVPRAGPTSRSRPASCRSRAPAR